MQVLRNGFAGLAGPPQDLIKSADGTLGASDVPVVKRPWYLDPATSARYRQPVASIPIPAISATPTTVLTFQVPSGFRFVLRAILNTFQSGIGGAPQFVDGSGDLVWSIDVDNPTGSVALSGYGLADLAAITEQRGSLRDGPWKLEGYVVFGPYDTLRYKILNVASGAAGVPNYTTCGLFGWLDPLL